VGDNVVTTSENTPWYNGKSILQTLESVELDGTEDLEARFKCNG
jgi:sulfate adenylyltransferase subunit 1